MSVRTLLQLGDPGLRAICVGVPDPKSVEVASVVRDLADTLAHWRKTTGYGRAIAAPQIGVTQRIVFMQLPGAEPWPFVNPEIVDRTAEKIVGVEQRASAIRGQRACPERIISVEDIP